MFKRIFLLALILTLALPARAAPAAGTREVTHYSLRGLSARANFVSQDETGCIETSVFMWPTDGKVKEDGKPAVESQVSISLYQYDYCLYKTLMSAIGYATLAPGDFAIKRNLSSASLIATVFVTDYENDRSFPVTLNVTWTGKGDLSSDKYIEHIQGPGFRNVYRHSGLLREATAAGRVSAIGIEFAPQATDYAFLYNTRDGDITITN